MKKLSLALMVTLYVAAGINHFWHPQFYISIIPPYLPQPELLNIITGVCELVLGILLIFPASRKFACYSVVAMLVAFIPAHVYTIQKSNCTGNAVCPDQAIAWVRLFIIHPFLIAWPVYIKNRIHAKISSRDPIFFLLPAIRHCEALLATLRSSVVLSGPSARLFVDDYYLMFLRVKKKSHNYLVSAPGIINKLIGYVKLNFHTNINAGAVQYKKVPFDYAITVIRVWSVISLQLSF